MRSSIVFAFGLLLAVASVVLAVSTDRNFGLQSAHRHTARLRHLRNRLSVGRNRIQRSVSGAETAGSAMVVYSIPEQPHALSASNSEWVTPAYRYAEVDVSVRLQCPEYKKCDSCVVDTGCEWTGRACQIRPKFQNDMAWKAVQCPISEGGSCKECMENTAKVSEDALCKQCLKNTVKVSEGGSCKECMKISAKFFRPAGQGGSLVDQCFFQAAWEGSTENGGFFKIAGWDITHINSCGKQKFNEKEVNEKKKKLNRSFLKVTGGTTCDMYDTCAECNLDEKCIYVRDSTKLDAGSDSGECRPKHQSNNLKPLEVIVPTDKCGDSKMMFLLGVHSVGVNEQAFITIRDQIRKIQCCTPSVPVCVCLGFHLNALSVLFLSVPIFGVFGIRWLVFGIWIYGWMDSV